MNYNVAINDFKGPLNKLLELVEEKEFDINQVSLAKITGDFLSYLEQLKRRDAPHFIIADFLLVASKLLLIKSRIIIPALEISEEDEEDIAALEIQLKLYKRIKFATHNIQDSWSVMPKIATRQFLMSKKEIFMPPSSITKNDINKAFMAVIKEIEKFTPVERIETKIINLQNKIREVVARLTNHPKKLQHLSDGDSRSELAVLFLAVLHLLREESVEVKQNNHFGEIIIRKTKNG